MRTIDRWEEIGAEAARDDWRAGNRDEATHTEVRLALLGHYDTDLSDPAITEQSDEWKTVVLDALTTAYMVELRRLRGG